MIKNLGKFFLVANVFIASLSSASETQTLLTRLKLKPTLGMTVKGKLDISKSSPLLKKPAESKVSIEATSKSISWSLLEPQKLTFVFDGQSTVVNGKKLDNDKTNLMRPLLETLMSIMNQDWAAIEKSFTISEQNQIIDLTPKGSAPIEKISMEFNKDDLPTVITLKSKSDLTTMKFSEYSELKEKVIAK